MGVRTILIMTMMATAMSLLIGGSAHAAGYTFPVLGASSFTNDFAAPRGSETHNAIDIIADKHQQIVSATDGVIEHVFSPQPSWGYSVVIRSTGNYCYWYIHMNNDTPGTDDGKGGEMRAYATDMKPGNPVKRGQLIGWVGDSGASESTVSHLHFEVLKPTNGRCDFTTGTHVNPYLNLKSAVKVSRPVSYPALAGEILPFGNTYTGGVNIASGDIDGDGNDETLVGAGKRGGPKVAAYDDADMPISSFYAFASDSPRYGTDVAVGDVDGDGSDEVLAVSQLADREMIAIFKFSAPNNFVKVGEFRNTTDKNPKSTSRISVVDINGDNQEEIVIGAGENAPPEVVVFDKNGTHLSSVMVYDPSFKGGVDVAGIRNSLGTEVIAAAPYTIGSSKVVILANDLTVVRQFYTYGSAFRGGISIAAGNPDGSGNDRIGTASNRHRPNVKRFTQTGSLVSSVYYWENWWIGDYDVALNKDGLKAATGTNRRGSVR